LTIKVLVSCLHLQRQFEDYRPEFAARGVEAVLPEVVQQMSEKDLLPMIHSFDGVIAGDDEITGRVIARAERLKVIVKWGIGTDAIDIEAARRAGISVLNTPGVFADEVADVVIGYLVLLARKLHEIDSEVRSGRWPKPQGLSLSGKVLGLVGVGSIGRGVARRARAMGFSLLGYDVGGIPEPAQRGLDLRPVDLETLLATSDFISLNCPLTQENYHLLDQYAFARMKLGVYIVNTARGPLIDERALAANLESGRVAGAALDVFEEEPLPPSSPLRRFDSCILGSHNASNTREAVLRVNRIAVDRLFAELEREKGVSAARGEEL
jgi:D-3-phosphoglycerate dehydrogenase